MNTKHPNVARAEYKRTAEHEWGTEHGWNRKHKEPPEPTVTKHHFHRSPLKKMVQDDVNQDMALTEKGTYIIEWGSMFRDLAALFLEGMGIVIFGHLITIAAICMLVGVGLGLFGLRVKTKHIRRG